jgi:hypothetical protein
MLLQGRKSPLGPERHGPQLVCTSDLSQALSTYQLATKNNYYTMMMTTTTMMMCCTYAAVLLWLLWLLLLFPARLVIPLQKGNER